MIDLYFISIFDSIIGVCVLGTMIYGVSNTIEYIKSNEKAKELPNKVVMALDKWLEREINDEKGGQDE